MTPLALQRVAVRMLFDPAFAERVRRDPDGALLGLDWSDDDVRMLRAPDPRAWQTDPYRRARALKGLLEEFPASAALAGVAGLDAFLSSREFHECIQEGGSLALAFGEWLSPRAMEMTRLELAIAQARRPPEPPHSGIGGEALFIRPAGSTLLHTREGLPAARAAILEALGPDPVAALVERDVAVPPLALGETEEWLLVLPATDGPRVEHLPAALGAALGNVRVRTREGMLAALRAEGAEPGEDEEILQDLLRDGLLVRV